ncbi:peptidylprolyl isomerase [Sulfurimonas sp. HSL-3221]|uniref:peptidylprolyl isomerase n=1 Tax=Sulfurimonadaceae TaxID=2771471 RepID=UPI001E564FE5|nr:peptidylprolyl isomerase [Sulfurimonas sp. HSL-3221]UFS63433.1 peptidylprolyl isomerase [Sulfurimonas sp. HSL-3221]
MITWMQRHRKYLVITIWISTIAFIGAGFVGWGQYSYGDKSGAVAKVGDVSITSRELQKTYAQLFNRYSQIFQGKFDEEQAKKLGLDKQALQQLVNQALLVNLANSYNLETTDKEVATVLQSQEAFIENGVFSKELYQKVLKQNRLTPVDYEADIRRALLIQKLFALFPAQANGIEKSAFETALGIGDKFEYKVLDGEMVSIDTSDAALKTFWEGHKLDYMTPRAFKIAYITQAAVEAGAGDEELQTYYDAHKYDFVGPDGKILAFENAKSAVVAAVNDKATNKEALKTYIAYKKEKLDADVKIVETTVREGDNSFSAETMQAIASADAASPYLKPKKEHGAYLIIKRLETVEPMPKSFEAAKTDVLAAYTRQMRAEKLTELATSSLKSFRGTATEGYLKRDATSGVEGLDEKETQALLASLFRSRKAESMAQLPSGKIVLYRILDQQINPVADANADQAVAQTKETLFSQSLITALAERYETQIFIKGYGQ